MLYSVLPPCTSKHRERKSEQSPDKVSKSAEGISYLIPSPSRGNRGTAEHLETHHYFDQGNRGKRKMTEKQVLRKFVNNSGGMAQTDFKQQLPAVRSLYTVLLKSHQQTGAL